MSASSSVAPRPSFDAQAYAEKSASVIGDVNRWLDKNKRIVDAPSPRVGPYEAEVAIESAQSPDAIRAKAKYWLERLEAKDAAPVARHRSMSLEASSSSVAACMPPIGVDPASRHHHALAQDKLDFTIETVRRHLDHLGTSSFDLPATQSLARALSSLGKVFSDRKADPALVAPLQTSLLDAIRSGRLNLSRLKSSDAAALDKALENLGFQELRGILSRSRAIDRLAGGAAESGFKLLDLARKQTNEAPAETFRTLARLRTPEQCAHDWLRLEDVLGQLHAKVRKAPKLQHRIDELNALREALRARSREGGNGERHADAWAKRAKPERFHSAGYHGTSWGFSLRVPLGRGRSMQISSVGQVLDFGLRKVLSSPLRFIGKKIQGDRSSRTRRYAGAVFKGLGNVLGGGISAACATVSLAEAGVANVVGGTLRLIGAGIVAAASGAAKLAGSPAGDRWLNTAKKLARISYIEKASQEPLPESMYKRLLLLEQLFRTITTGTKWVREAGTLGAFDKVRRSDIPRSILRAGDGGTGDVATLTFDEETSCLKSHTWSGLKIGVHTEMVGGQRKFILAFVGTKMGVPATIKADIVAAFGVKEATGRKAKDVVRAFIDAYGAENVELIGHSLGGALATYAGAKNSNRDRHIPVTTFNGAGIAVHVRDILGAEALDNTPMIHVNNSRDWLSQGLEHGIFGADASSQPGMKFEVPGTGGHKLSTSIARLAQLNRDHPAGAPLAT